MERRLHGEGTHEKRFIGSGDFTKRGEGTQIEKGQTRRRDHTKKNLGT